MKTSWITAHPIRHGSETTQAWKFLVTSPKVWPRWFCMRLSLCFYKWDKMASLCPACAGVHKGLLCSQQWLGWWTHQLSLLLWWCKSQDIFYKTKSFCTTFLIFEIRFLLVTVNPWGVNLASWQLRLWLCAVPSGVSLRLLRASVFSGLPCSQALVVSHLPSPIRPAESPTDVPGVMMLLSTYHGFTPPLS